MKIHGETVKVLFYFFFKKQLFLLDIFFVLQSTQNFIFYLKRKKKLGLSKDIIKSEIQLLERKLILENKKARTS